MKVIFLGAIAVAVFLVMSITNPSEQQHLAAGSRGGPYKNFFVFSLMPAQESLYFGENIGERTGGSFGVLNNVWMFPGISKDKERQAKDEERQARYRADNERMHQEEERMRRMQEDKTRAAFSAAAAARGFSPALEEQLFEFYVAVQDFLGHRRPNEEVLCEAVEAAGSEADMKLALREIIFKRCIDLSGYPDVYQQIKGREAEHQLERLDSALDEIFGN